MVSGTAESEGRDPDSAVLLLTDLRFVQSKRQEAFLFGLINHGNDIVY